MRRLVVVCVLLVVCLQTWGFSFEVESEVCVCYAKNEKIDNIRRLDESIFAFGDDGVKYEKMSFLHFNRKKISIKHTFYVDENSAKGIVMGEVAALSLGDEYTGKKKYAIIDGNEKEFFAIDSLGFLSVNKNKALDHETQSQYLLQVELTDGDLSDFTTVLVYVNNLNDNKPKFPIPISFTLDENTNAGASAGTIVAEDPDGKLNKLSYSFVSEPKKLPFNLLASGELIVKKGAKLDYESKNKYNIVVRVSDGEYAETTPVKIHLNNLNDSKPILPNKDVFSVDENSTNGVVVGVFSASDADGDLTKLTHSILTTTANLPFQIDEAGQILVKETELLDYEKESHYEFTVGVTDGNFSDSKVIVVKVNNKNDNAPEFNKETFLNLDENSPKGTVVGSTMATDLDGELTPLVYSIVDGDSQKAFIVNKLGDIMVDRQICLDYEKCKKFNLQVEVTDGLYSASRSVEILINNLNDNAPEIPSKFDFTVIENSPLNTPVGLLSALDADGDLTPMTYSIVGGNPQNVFVINDLGSLTVANPTVLDYEMLNRYELAVEVTDGVHVTSSIVRVDLVNVNDNAPYCAEQSFEIDEHAPFQSEVGVIEAYDIDDLESSITYTIVSGDSQGLFSVSNSGKLFVKNGGLLDFEQKQLFELGIELNDGELKGLGIVKVTLNNINDNVPTIRKDTFTVFENRKKAHRVGQILANDLDGKLNPLTLSIVGGNEKGVFEVSSSGAITVLADGVLDYELQKRYILTIEVTDGELSSQEQITIDLQNENDNEPHLDFPVLSIDENSPNETFLAQLEPLDLDGDLNELHLSIVGQSPEGIFYIDSENNIKVKSSSKLDYENVHISSMTIKVSDGNFNKNFNTTIQINNLNDNPAKLQTTLFSVKENVEAGESVGLFSAQDLDGAISKFTYRILEGNKAGAFEVTELGKLVVKKSNVIDYETLDHYALTIELSDGLNLDTGMVKVQVLDINDVVPTLESHVFTITEDAEDGALVGRVDVKDVDSDSFNYFITNGNLRNAFSIDENGDVFLRKNELIDHEKHDEFKLSVKVSDGLNVGVGEIYVRIADVDDTAPVIKPSDFYVDENAEKDILIGALGIIDPDSPHFKCTFLEGNEKGTFRLDKYGKLFVNNSKGLDYETQNIYDLVVLVEDSLHKATVELKVFVRNRNDHPPMVLGTGFIVNENLEHGVKIGDVNFFDADNGLNELSIEITKGNIRNAFLINKEGALIVNNRNALDYESVQKFQLMISVSDGYFTSRAPVVVSLINKNDNAPTLTGSGFMITTNAQNGDEIGHMFANDTDLNTLVFSIAGGNENDVFEIDSLSGKIYIKNIEAIEFSRKKPYNVLVEVTDGKYTSDAIVSFNLETVLSTIEQKPTAEINCYPNPTTGRLAITLNNPTSFLTQVCLLSLKGEIAYFKRLDKVSNYELELFDLEKGYYLVKLQVDGKEHTLKLLLK